MNIGNRGHPRGRRCVAAGLRGNARAARSTSAGTLAPSRQRHRRHRRRASSWAAVEAEPTVSLATPAGIPAIRRLTGALVDININNMLEPVGYRGFRRTGFAHARLPLSFEFERRTGHRPRRVRWPARAEQAPRPDLRRRHGPRDQRRRLAPDTGARRGDLRAGRRRGRRLRLDRDCVRGDDPSGDRGLPAHRSSITPRTRSSTASTSGCTTSSGARIR